MELTSSLPLMTNGSTAAGTPPNGDAGGANGAHASAAPEQPSQQSGGAASIEALKAQAQAQQPPASGSAPASDAAGGAAPAASAAAPSTNGAMDALADLAAVATPANEAPPPSVAPAAAAAAPAPASVPQQQLAAEKPAEPAPTPSAAPAAPAAPAPESAPQAAQSGPVPAPAAGPSSSSEASSAPPQAQSSAGATQPTLIESTPVAAAPHTSLAPAGQPKAEPATPTPAPNGAAPSAPATQSQAPASSAASEPARSSDAEPPHKRQRTTSDFDPSIIIGGEAGKIELTVHQIKYAQNCLKGLKGRNEARAFLAPVDPVAMGIPHYRNVIATPMDLGTVDIKLALTAAAAKGGNKPTEKVRLAPKWGLDVARDVYTTREAFERDVRLVFQNCRTFNGPAHIISQSADALEAVFDKQMATFPSKDAVPPPEAGAAGAPIAAAQFAAGAAGAAAGPSAAAPFGGLGAYSLADNRPKREVHPPPPRDIAYDEPQALKTKKKLKKSRASMTPAEAAHWDRQHKEELRFCTRVIDDLLKPTHRDVAWVFYELPDKSYDFAPAYYAMIKKPVSLMLVQRKLKRGDYADADEVDADMQLLFNNCFAFNPPGSDVAIMGEKLKQVYEKMFARRPESTPYAETISDDDEPDEASILAQALRGQIDMLDQQARDLEGGKASAKALAVAKGTLSSLGALPDLPERAAPVRKDSSAAAKRRKSVGAGDAPKKAKKPRRDDARDGGAAPKKKKAKKSSPSAAAAGGGGSSSKAAAPRRAAAADDDDEDDVRVVTYEQKEELANKIALLPEDRLDGALKIIAEDKPQSANDEDEIELDIDDLTPKTLYKLYRYVVRPKTKKTSASHPAKSAGDGRKRGTGGVKRKNLDEGEESERIRRLQAQLEQFEGGAGGAAQAGGHDDLVVSESSADEDEDDSEDSGSDY